MSVTESDNQLSFHGADGAADIPAAGKETFLEAISGHPGVKPGASLACFGTAFVEGQLQMVAAYRPA